MSLLKCALRKASIRLEFVEWTLHRIYSVQAPMRVAIATDK